MLCTDPIRSGDNVNVVQESEEPLSGEQSCPDRLQRLHQGEQEGHKSVPLFPPFSLVDVNLAEFIFPHTPRRLTVEGTHKRQRFRPSQHGDQSFQHGLSRDGVVCPHSVDRHDRGLRVNLGEHLKNMSHTLCPSSRGHSLAELLGHRSCHQPAIPLTPPERFWGAIILP